MNPPPAATPETATATASAAATPHRGGIPEEIIIWEIVPRLPARALLRCLAVCRSWRRALTFKPNSDLLLLAHHRLQPSLPLASCVQFARHDLRAVSPAPPPRSGPSPRSAKGIVEAASHHPSILLRQSLHFYSVKKNSSTNMVMVFSTTAESFRGKLLSDFQYHEQSLLIVPYKLKESLLRHTFFPSQRDEGANASLSPFM